MSFIPQAHIEDRAAALWQRYRLTPGFDIERLLDHLGLSLLWEAVDDDRGRILPDKRIVILNERQLDALEAKNGRLRRYTIGHEVGLVPKTRAGVAPTEGSSVAHHPAATTSNDASMTSRRPTLPTRRFPLLVEPPAGIQPATPALPWIGG
jgi:hypothetical protein